MRHINPTPPSIDIPVHSDAWLRKLLRHEQKLGLSSWRCFRILHLQSNEAHGSMIYGSVLLSIRRKRPKPKLHVPRDLPRIKQLPLPSFKPICLHYPMFRARTTQGRRIQPKTNKFAWCGFPYQPLDTSSAKTLPSGRLLFGCPSNHPKKKSGNEKKWMR